MKHEIRKRWGVQHDMRMRGAPKPMWCTIGVSWVDHDAKLPSCVDFYPANYQTRQEARAVAKRLTEDAQVHSPHWRFRAVPLSITVRIGHDA